MFLWLLQQLFLLLRKQLVLPSPGLLVPPPRVRQNPTDLVLPAYPAWCPGLHPAGREAGNQQIILKLEAKTDPLLSAFPETFTAHLTHMQTIVELPPGASALAYSSHDPHQIVRYGPNAMSVQFHPEFTSTPRNGHPLFIAYVRAAIARSQRAGAREAA